MTTSSSAAKQTRLVIGPNASLSRQRAWWFLAWMAFIAFAVAGYFAVRGYWPVLPFAGLEIIALAVALAVCMRHNRYREVVCFDGEWIHVEIGLVGQGVLSSTRLRRSSTRALVEAGPYRNSPSRLVLACGDLKLEVGHCLTDEERVALCRRLRQLIHPGWERPVPVEPEQVWH